MLTTLPPNTKFLHTHEYVVEFRNNKPTPLGYIILEEDEELRLSMRVVSKIQEGAIPFYIDLRLREMLSTLIRRRIKLQGIVDIKVDECLRATHAVFKIKSINFLSP